jgi:DNA polymerase III subunit beta
MKAIQLPVNALKAMSVLASKQDIRYYLNGVLVQSNDAYTRLVATDGTLLGIYQISETAHNGESFSIIVPNEIIAKLDKRDNFLSCENGKWTIDGMAFSPVDGTFPDYMRVLPTKPATGESAQFNPELITRFVKCSKLLNGTKHPVIAHNGGSSALVDLGLDRFIGVVMPMRNNVVINQTPPWVKIINEMA